MHTSAIDLVTVDEPSGRLISERELAPHSPEVICAQLRETCKMLGLPFMWHAEDEPVPVGGRITFSTPAFTAYIERTL